MLDLVLGPLFIAGGMAAVYLGRDVARSRRPSVVAARPSALQPDDTIVADLLSEMLRLREEKAEIEQQIAALRTRLGAPSAA
jgi:hypothetical protein